MSRGPFVVSADWLQERLGQEGIRIVDASWYLPAQGRDGRSEFEAGHIPGAVFFDHDEVVDPDSRLPHALPSAEVFRAHVEALGISSDDCIVVHDGPGFFSAPRAWWMFRIMGAGQVLLLDGGLDRWKSEGRPLTSEPTPVRPASFRTRFDPAAIVPFEEMRRVVEAGEVTIADARAAARFEGTAPEPRPGMRSGHMPGAVSVPASELARDGSMLELNELRRLFGRRGVDLAGPVVTTCGSGITAAAISFALQSLGHRDNRLYDGSWSEWGGRDDTPVETGAGTKWQGNC